MGTEKYACDSCRLSKVTCSRDRSGCKRCIRKGAKCAYSRSGVIRRRKKNKNETENVRQSNLEKPINDSSSSGVQCHLAVDIEATRQQLNDIDTPEQHSSLDALFSLSKTCAGTSIQKEDSRLHTAAKEFHLFEEHTIKWAELFENFLHESGPSIGTAPPDVINHLRAGRPHKVRERAWLVMYYSIILSTVTSTSLKEKLHTNIWLTLSDVGVLLEPSEANITAIVLVLSQASDFTGPSLCWMLAANACRMLQALGVNQHYLDRNTRERRRKTFWHLNLLDKGLAIIFGRTPTFHREMVKEIGLPTLEQIQPFRPHLTSTGAPGFFGAHYMYQKVLLSHLMDDIWHCLYGEEKPNHDSIETANKDLVSWYDQARRILEAAALSEKPFCDAKHAKSIDIALHSIEFHFLYLTILLARSSTYMQERCLDASRRMLHLLLDMTPKSKEPYHPIIWQLVCCPFTPLLILFRDIISNGKRNLEEKKEALAAMEQFPSYLKDLSSRSSLADSLEGIARVFVKHARSVIFPDSSRKAVQSLTVPLGTSPHGSDRANIDSFDSNDAPIPSISMQLEPGDFDLGLSSDFAMFTNSFDSDGIFDWLGWESRVQ